MTYDCRACCMRQSCAVHMRMRASKVSGLEKHPNIAAWAVFTARISKIYRLSPARAGQDRIRDRPLHDGTETKRLLDVLDKRLAQSEYVAGPAYTIADMAAWPWYGGLVKFSQYGATEFLNVQEYKNVNRWADQIYALGSEPIPLGRPAGRFDDAFLLQQLTEQRDPADIVKGDIHHERDEHDGKPSRDHFLEPNTDAAPRDDLIQGHQCGRHPVRATATGSREPG